MSKTSVIAIVDDDEGVRVATGSFVRSLGYAARTYASASEFLQACAEQEPACLITDVQMPELDGVELQQALIAAAHRIPIIFVTAFPTETVRQSVLAAGASGFLRKPCDCDAIVRCLQEAVGSPAE
ncbi:response regulator transcription factor [Methylobacterium durans]|uniref:Two-component system response regulator n=1 Tax=Methylobacterium durans TaxID=2202825 RepID=A0A2U8W9J4_9HYPH|nr:response regulator [Methylobacterium durans]AWN42288.1 two-component system response regulator [Methylobacterium durans]